MLVGLAASAVSAWAPAAVVVFGACGFSWVWGWGCWAGISPVETGDAVSNAHTYSPGGNTQVAGDSERGLLFQAELGWQHQQQQQKQQDRQVLRPVTSCQARRTAAETETEAAAGADAAAVNQPHSTPWGSC